ncbi:MAG TPA: hypothetical protein GX503_01470 [Clostridiales bacterium]|nr:hypothetical protein [Clostridiales bacterium]
MKKRNFEDIPLIVSDEFKKVLEERLISLEDIQQVIAYAEETGLKIYNPEKDYYIAHYKPKIVTYWVVYSVKEDAYLIHNAYSHRLEIVEDVMGS